MAPKDDCKINFLPLTLPGSGAPLWAGDQRVGAHQLPPGVPQPSVRHSKSRVQRCQLFEAGLRE